MEKISTFSSALRAQRIQSVEASELHAAATHAEAAAPTLPACPAPRPAPALVFSPYAARQSGARRRFFGIYRDVHA